MNTDKIYAEQLANEYAPKKTSKVVALRKLDAKAKLPATVFTYTLGIVSALVFGVGMCLSMKVIGDGSMAMMIAGIAVGILGMAGMGADFPIYRKILARGKQKYAYENRAGARDKRGKVSLGTRGVAACRIPHIASRAVAARGAVACVVPACVLLSLVGGQLIVDRMHGVPIGGIFAHCAVRGASRRDSALAHVCA